MWIIWGEGCSGERAEHVEDLAQLRNIEEAGIAGAKPVGGAHGDDMMSNGGLDGEVTWESTGMCCASDRSDQI